MPCRAGGSSPEPARTNTPRANERTSRISSMRIVAPLSRTWVRIIGSRGTGAVILPARGRVQGPGHSRRKPGGGILHLVVVGVAGEEPPLVVELLLPPLPERLLVLRDLDADDRPDGRRLLVAE